MVSETTVSEGTTNPASGPRGPGASHSVTDLLERTDALMRAGLTPGATVWPTGFDPLDSLLRGGCRSGELVLLAGSQGQGKTTFGLQLLRSAVTSGKSGVFFSFEHESTTLLERLLAMEAAYAAELAGDGALPVDVTKVRKVFEEVGHEGRPLAEALDGLPHAIGGLRAVEAYGSLLHVHESTPLTDVEVMTSVIAEVADECGEAPIVLVDYLQKIPGAGVDEVERTTAVVEALKDLALEIGVPVVAISAAEKEHLGAGRRMRAEHLRGSSALAYESDVVLVLSDKADIVSREHLVYDLTSMQRYRQWAVVTVEKNRHGEDHVELEFRKDFAHGRFDPVGGLVQERLIEERVFRT
jgi:replicative DNA helicase